MEIIIENLETKIEKVEEVIEQLKEDNEDLRYNYREAVRLNIEYEDCLKGLGEANLIRGSSSRS